MNMSTEDAAVCHACTFGLIMGENKGPGLQLTANTDNICFGIPFFGQDIVVANDQFYA